MIVERAFTVAGIVVVAAALVLGFLFLGTPGHARQRAMDRKRIDDLYDIASRIHAEYAIDYALPSRLPPEIQKTDPFTGRPYEYVRLNGRRFRLCATFATTNSEQDDTYAPLRGGDWSHRAGRGCYKFDMRSIDMTPVSDSTH